VKRSYERAARVLSAEHGDTAKASSNAASVCATFKIHLGWWQNYPVDLRTIKARYNAAFEAYQVRKRNAEQTPSGEKPSAADIAHEKKALRAVKKARQALLTALAMDGEGHRIRLNLERAERHVLKGERLVERQRATVEELRRDGHNVDLATGLLAEMEKSLRLHIGDRDRLVQQYAGFSR
jgi:hypothetical protein